MISIFHYTWFKENFGGMANEEQSDKSRDYRWIFE